MLQEIKKIFADSMTPAVRAWIRYSPLTLGKTWLWEKFRWRDKEFVCKTKFGMQVTGNTHDQIQRYLYYFGIWEPNITHWISSSLKAGDCFIDVGANIGYYSLLASKLVGESGKVVAVEAAPWIHAMLNKQIELNRLRNVRTVSAAAAETRGVLKIFAGAADNIGSTTTVSSRLSSEKPAAEVKAFPLSEILTEDEVKRTRIIKIDVEGAELSVLRGLAPVLSRLRPDCEILMEVSENLTPETQEVTSEIFSLMQKYGFSAFVMENDYSSKSYLLKGTIKRPVALTGTRIESQVDVLFSKASY